jgi:glutamate-1-semialdehyde 2,1-aminomutase
MASSPLTFHRSDAYHEKARAVIAGGVNSNVRLAARPPICFARAAGPHLTDIDGNTYIDYALGMGPAILGHAPAAVTDAVARVLSDGQLFAGQSSLELELARRLQRYIPGAELVRIGMSGSEMIQVAIRIARAATSRARIIKFAGHYHGWFDNVFAGPPAAGARDGLVVDGAAPLTAGQNQSALNDTLVLDWNDLGALEACFARTRGEIAAVLMEPVMCNSGVIPPAPGYLEGVRALCSRHGAILIIDEVITGFRLGLSGAQGRLGITGDLAVFAKAVGGGFPVAALTGRRDLMSLVASGRVNHSGTYNANVVSLSAAIATLDQLAANNGAAYRQIEECGRALMAGLRQAAAEERIPIVVQGFAGVFMTCFSSDQSIASLQQHQRADESLQRRFIDALTNLGVRPTNRGTWFVSAAHREAHIEETIRTCRKALASLH